MQAEDWIWPTGGGLLTPGLDQPGMVDLCLILKATILSIWGFSPLRWTKPGTSSVLQVSDGSKFLLEVVITGLEIHSLALLIANFQRFYLGTVHPPPPKKKGVPSLESFYLVELLASGLVVIFMALPALILFMGRVLHSGGSIYDFQSESLLES